MKNDWISDIRMGGSIPNGESLKKSEYSLYSSLFHDRKQQVHREFDDPWLCLKIGPCQKKTYVVDHIWYWYVQVLGEVPDVIIQPVMNQVTGSSGCFVAKVTGNGQPDTDHEVSGHAEAEAEDDATPRKINMKPEDTPLEEENHRLKPSFSGFSW